MMSPGTEHTAGKSSNGVFSLDLTYGADVVRESDHKLLGSDHSQALRLSTAFLCGTTRHQDIAPAQGRRVRLRDSH